MKITHCQTNHLYNPLGYAIEQPVFCWQVEEATGKKQAAARIVVKNGSDVVTDTDWTDLDSLCTPVNICPTPRTRYTWTVSVRTDAGEEATSDEHWFETAKQDEPWQGAWIGCDEADSRHPVFSKAITPRRPIAQARLYICGLGLYEAAWNGEKIGGEVLTPYCSAYNAQVQYQTFDVTEQLQEPGTLAVTLGNGWFGGRFGLSRDPRPVYGGGWKLLAELRLRYADGSEEVIGTDDSWQVTRSNITFSNIYDGEHRDDTLRTLPAVPAGRVQPPQGELCARHSTPVMTRAELTVQALLHTPAGETVLDMGQEITGGFRLSLCVPRGQTVRLQFGEVLQGGNFYRDNLRTAKAEYVYISDGEAHVLEPKFTYYGYRYVKIEGIDELRPEDFTALLWHSELPPVGHLTTGQPLVNRLIANVAWSQLDNFLDVPTDCPQRDERLGWTGDARVFAPTACYLRNCTAFFDKYLWDMAAEQATRGGEVPDIVPSFGRNGCSAAWGDAACELPWTLYEYSGDRALLARHYPIMTAWVDYITAIDGTHHGWRRHFHYGDWLALDGNGSDSRQGGTDVAFVADTQYRRSVLLTAKAARVLNKTEDAVRYEKLAEKLLADIRAEYFTPTGRCAVPTQTGLLLSLQDRNAPDLERTAYDLVEKVKAADGKLQTGFVGTPLLAPTLTAAGHSDLSYDLLLYEGYPGWLYAVKLGATTVWERWNSLDENGVIAENGMNSLNHYAYGSIVDWLYRDAVGLTPAEPGFRKARLTPQIDARLGRAEVEYRSAAGLWRVGWSVLPDGDICYHCTVPFGCTAELSLPYGGGEQQLDPGEFERTYTPDRPLRKTLSTATPVVELLQNPAARALLQKIMPQITQLPPSMQGMSMRDIAAKMGGEQSIPFDKMDEMLKSLFY
mgnify:CR=1 FL=1